MSVSEATLATLNMPANTEEWFKMASANSLNIVRIERELINLSVEIEGLRRGVSTLEATTAAQVTAEQDGNGKAKFSNETSRKAEIAARLERSEDYEHASTMLRVRELSQRLLQIELSEAQRLFSLAKAGLNAQAN